MHRLGKIKEDQWWRMKPLISQPTFVNIKTRPEFFGILFISTKSSKSQCSVTNIEQLQLQERDGYGGIEESGCHLLSKFTFAVSVFHKLFPQGLLMESPYGLSSSLIGS